MATKPGDSNAITRAYFDSLLIEMRLIGATLPSTKLELYGKTFDSPIMMAAFSHMKTLKDVAYAAKESNIVNWVGMGSEEQLEELISTGAETIKIIKPYEDNDRILKKIHHAEEAGALAVGMDIDHAFNRTGGYDVVAGEEMRPKTVDEIREFVRATSLPFIIKGVLSVADAKACVEAGAGGILLSHHHGIMDYAVPPTKLLPEVAEAVGGRIPIFVDCGIASGADAFKCLALGATAVCVGRALLEAMNEDPERGAVNCIRSMTGELASFLAHTGSPDPRHIDPAVVHTLG